MYYLYYLVGGHSATKQKIDFRHTVIDGVHCGVELGYIDNGPVGSDRPTVRYFRLSATENEAGGLLYEDYLVDSLEEGREVLGMITDDHLRAWLNRLTGQKCPEELNHLLPPKKRML